jgi:histidinol-phosphate aminotransferase
VAAAVREHGSEVVFLCSPNNPTGMSERRETVSAAAEAAAATGALLIVDEAYAEFSGWTALELLDGTSNVDGVANVVVSRTFSKTWALAALRLGYCIASADVVDTLDAAVLPYHLDAFKQAAGLAALSHDGDMAARVESIVSERARIVAALSGMAVRHWESGANFVLFRPEPARPGLWQGLVDRGVLVRDCGAWPGLEGCLRVTVGTAQENDAFLDALGACLAGGQ